MWPSIFLNSAWIMMKEPSPLYKTVAELSCPVHQLLVLATKKKTRLKIVAVTYIFSRVRKSALLWNTSISKISISKALLFQMVRNLWRGFPEILLASVTDSLLRRSCAPTKASKSVWLDTGAVWVTFHAYILRIAWLKDPFSRMDTRSENVYHPCCFIRWKVGPASLEIFRATIPAERWALTASV